MHARRSYKNVNLWDLARAMRAGLRTAWVAGADTLMPETPAPGYQRTTLAAVAAEIAAV